MTRKRTSELGFRALTLAARIQAALAVVGPVVRSTPLLGAALVLAALAAIPHGGRVW